MLIAAIAMATVFGWAFDEVQAEIVAKLGSPSFAEREAGADSLGRLGRPVQPALRKPRSEQDLEIRMRAANLRDEIRPTRADSQAHLRCPLQERGVARNQNGGPGQVGRLVGTWSIGDILARARQAKLARRDTPRSMQPSTVHQSRSWIDFRGTHRFGNARLLTGFRQ
jgi:hypothetical protein